MNKIYDNGSYLLGNINVVINDIRRKINDTNEKLYDEMVDEYKELLDELVKVRDKQHAKYVVINYDNPMGYTFEYFSDTDEEYTWDFKYDIEDYIEGEKDFIKQDMQTEMAQGIDPRGLEKDLAYLNSLDNNDINNITEKVFYDESLNETFNDLVHYYLYHYDKYIKGGER